MRDTLTHGGISIEIIAHRKPERKDGELEWCPGDCDHGPVIKDIEPHRFPGSPFLYSYCLEKKNNNITLATNKPSPNCPVRPQGARI